MVVQAVVLALSGVLLRDRRLRQQLMNELLLAENLRPDGQEYDLVCEGCGDRTCLGRLLERRGRVVTVALLEKLLAQRSQQYQAALGTDSPLPLYPGAMDFLYQCQVAHIPMALVTGLEDPDAQWVLERAGWGDRFAAVITTQHLSPQGDRPAGEGHTKAIAQLRQQFPDRPFDPAHCLAIEASFEGIAAAKAAGLPVVGVAHHYPYQMMHRRADWVVDYLNELQWDWFEPVPVPLAPD